MRNTPLLALLAICLVATGFGAARFLPYDAVSSDDEVSSLGIKDFPGNLFSFYLKQLGTSRKGSSSFGEFHYSSRFVVKPEIRTEFEKEFEKYQDEVGDEDGLDLVALTKTESDNLVYAAYFEWQTLEDFLDHLEEGYFKDFEEFLEDNDIVTTLIPLTRIADAREARDSKVSRRGRKERDEEDRTHVLTRFIVPPSERDGFEDAWRDAAEDTWDEEANHEYSLHKVGADNLQYWVYGQWDTLDDYLDHFSSKHILKLRDYANDKSLVWFRTFLRPIGKAQGARRQ